jgi:hypothetical protein
MIDWFTAADFLRREAKRERERRESLGISIEQIQAMSQALRIFDRPSLQAFVAIKVAETLDQLAAVLEQRGREAPTPPPVPSTD